jgi:hypothetical protein
VARGRRENAQSSNVPKRKTSDKSEALRRKTFENR